MNAPDDCWVNKVHPLSREADANDPFELMATPAAGDPEVMLECMLQEFIWMGFGREELLALFHDPGNPMLCDLHAYYGPDEVERRVDHVLARTGHLQFTTFVAEPEEDEEHDHGPELLQILPMPESTACR